MFLRRTHAPPPHIPARISARAACVRLTDKVMDVLAEVEAHAVSRGASTTAGCVGRSNPCLGTVRADTDNPVYQIEINEMALGD